LAKPASTDKPASDLAMEAIRKLNAKLILSKANLADLMAIEPQTRGVPADRIAVDDQGDNTLATAQHTRAYLQAHRMSRVLIISQY
ncbi:ElyC/SanA/YdcF family protein, partial [Burkholderia sp. SIMBA_042]